MSFSRGAWTDDRIELIVGNLLRVGVLMAGALVLSGGGIFLASHGRDLPDYRHFVGQPLTWRTLHGTLSVSMILNGGALIEIGLLLLIATPVLRVGFLAIAFGLQGDRLYVGIALIVLAFLLCSLAGDDD